MEREPTYKCFSCPGPFHPATGDYDPHYRIARCGVCMKRFYQWQRGHMAREWSGQAFYEEAKTSNRQGENRYIVVVLSRRYMRVPNPKAKEKPSKRPGRWRAGPDGVRYLMGPKPVPAAIWVPA